MVKDVLTRLWKDRCQVTVRVPYKRPNQSTGFREEVVMEDVPCKLSFYDNFTSANAPVTPEGAASPLKQVVKLFVAPDKEIPPGSKITVTHNGKKVDYTHSGSPAVFTNHQEILLELFDKWA